MEFVIGVFTNFINHFPQDFKTEATRYVIGAVGIGELFEAATVAFLFALSLALESWSVGQCLESFCSSP